MPNLDSRQAVILLGLLEAEGPIPARTLGERLGLSARVVRYHLPLIRAWLAERGVELVTRSGRGTEVILSAEGRARLIEDLDTGGHAPQLDASSARRIYLFHLLWERRYVRSAEMATHLGVSRSTLSRHILEAEEWLRNRNLFLQRKPRNGTLIVGREEDMRHALLTLILEAGIEKELLDLCLWGKRRTSGPQSLRDPVKTMILDQVSRLDLEAAWRHVARVATELVATFPDHDHLALALSWSIAVWRIQNGWEIPAGSSLPYPDSTQPEYIAVAAAARIQIEETGIRLAPQEVRQMALAVMTSTRQSSHGRLGDSEPPLPIAPEYEDLARHMVEEIGARAGVELAHPEVIARLAEHLSRSVVRARHGLPIHNPLVHQVRQAYPDLWEAATDTADRLAHELGVQIPVDEVGFITMYMGMAIELNRRLRHIRRWRVVVACPIGGITAWMLVHRLETRLPELEVVDVISLRQLSRVDPQSVDAIISTVPTSARALPVITVSPLVDDRDVELLRRELGLHA